MDKRGTSEIVRDADGVYRWVYELRLMRNPVVFGTVFKIFAVMALVEFALIVVLGLSDGSNPATVLAEGAKTTLIILLLFFALTVVGYTLYAAMNGWKYCVLFEMDNEGVAHTQLPSQYDKARAVAKLAAAIGAAAGSATAAGAGLLSASHSSTSSSFASVRSVKVSNTWRYLKVNEPLAKNQVYASEADFPFVRDFILSHVPPEVAAKARR